jgi:hypothetical protein
VELLVIPIGQRRQGAALAAIVRSGRHTAAATGKHELTRLKVHAAL